MREMRPGSSLSPDYFETLFSQNPDPWNFATSAYECAKYDHTIASLTGRRYGKAFEIGCANGVLTQRLASLCDDLLAIDVSPTVLTLARARCQALSRVRFEEMVFPRVTPDDRGFDLVVISEVAYYWDDHDLIRAANWLKRSLGSDASIILVHWTGPTNYPQTADEAVEGLRDALQRNIDVTTETRHPEYRLDLWRYSVDENLAPAIER